MIGTTRQEILSGIRSESQFKKLQKHLESFPDIPILTEDYVTAARVSSRCRSKGVQGSNTDFLICAVAVRNRFSIYTADKGFELIFLTKNRIGLTTPIFMNFILRILVRKEETYLEHVFGSQYLEYKKNVPCILPFGWIKSIV